MTPNFKHNILTYIVQILVSVQSICYKLEVKLGIYQKGPLKNSEIMYENYFKAVHWWNCLNMWPWPYVTKVLLRPRGIQSHFKRSNWRKWETNSKEYEFNINHFHGKAKVCDLALKSKHVSGWFRGMIRDHNICFMHTQQIPNNHQILLIILKPINFCSTYAKCTNAKNK